MRVRGFSPHNVVPGFNDHVGWAEWWGREAEQASRRICSGTSKNVALDLEHVKRAARMAWSHACRLRGYKYWDARWTVQQRQVRDDTLDDRRDTART